MAWLGFLLIKSRREQINPTMSYLVFAINAVLGYVWSQKGLSVVRQLLLVLFVRLRWWRGMKWSDCIVCHSHPSHWTSSWSTVLPDKVLRTHRSWDACQPLVVLTSHEHWEAVFPLKVSHVINLSWLCCWTWDDEQTTSSFLHHPNQFIWGTSLK